MPNLLVYAETGIAVSNTSARINFGGPVTQETLTTPGIALGGGGEYALADSPGLYSKNLSLFAEYQHIWWTGDMTDTPVAVPTRNFHWQRDSDIVRTGIRLRF